MQSFRYTQPQIAVHWLAAIIIVFLLITGTFILADLPNTAPKIDNLRIHMVLGAAAGLLVIVRFGLRRIYPVPPIAPGDKSARIVHVLLNLIILGVVAHSCRK